MRIKQLILNGFKSFPDKTTVTFDPLVNAIVGPNGCGKSNVLDGLRWVMGEASFTQMRCAKTEDLIFSGNNVHPPDNFAEVTLILSNHEEQNSTQQTERPLYSLGAEIEVKRRFYRSGESEFFINRKSCKLKDIQDLFTSGGGSGHSYSIFDLPKMRQIISSNLKALFIEAAGLAFYQERKDEIERKLKLTSDDLIRLNDIIIERTRITRTLKRQAYRLMAFEKVKEQERHLRVALLKFDYQKVSAEEHTISEQVDLLASQIAAIENNITSAETRRSELRKILQEKEDVRSGLQKEIESIKEQVIINEERLKANLDKQSFLKTEQDKLQSEFSFVEQLKSNQQDLDSKKEYYNQLLNLLTGKEQDFEKVRQSNKDLDAELFSDQLAMDELIEKDKQIFIRLSQISTELSGLDTKLQDTNRYQQNLIDSIAALRYAKSEKISIRERTNLLQEKLGENFLGLVQEKISPKPGYEKAVESVLSNIYDAFIINSFSEFSLEKIPSSQQWSIIAQSYITNPQPRIPKPIFATPLGECIEIKSQLPSSLQTIIDSYVLVENYSDIQFDSVNELNYVTKSGIIFNKSGVLYIPKAHNEPELLTSDKSNLDHQIQALTKENEIIENRKKELEQTRQKLLTEKQEKDKEKIVVSNELKEKQEIINNKKLKVKENLESAGNFLFDLTKQREEISRLKAELDLVNTELARGDMRKNSISSIRQTLSELQNEENNLKSNIAELQEKLNRKKTEFEATALGQIAIEYDDLEIKVTEYRINLDNEKKKLSEKHLHRFELQTTRENIEKQANFYLPDALNILKSPDTGETNIEETKKQLNLIQKRITAIGLINPLAKDEYEKEKGALDKLTNQHKDIVTARDNLIMALKELTKKAEQMFLETYGQVQVSFQRIFKEIFVEGDADLMLETPANPLESEIRIIAKPRGKVPKRLDQLSDGEKALLALSLLFAFYDIKPAPFVFMDEVDAPLDDANVKRFTQFLKRISETTQVIIITHNKLTVEIAAVVIGVTTEEPGISKIVSVRFKDLPVTAVKSN